MPRIIPLFICPNPGLRLTFIETGIDFGNFRHPLPAFSVLQHQDLMVRPVKVKRDIRYLLIEPL